MQCFNFISERSTINWRSVDWTPWSSLSDWTSWSSDTKEKEVSEDYLQDTNLIIIIGSIVMVGMCLLCLCKKCITRSSGSTNNSQGKLQFLYFDGKFNIIQII